MRHKAKKMQEVEVVVSTTCDRCGSIIREKPFEVDEVELSHKSGDSYPEGSNITQEFADICPPCWETTIKPALITLGIKFQERDLSW